MKYTYVASSLALCLAASGALAQDASTQSASAGVALLAPQDTGFLFGATVGVNGVGSAAATVAETTSAHGFTGYASSGTESDRSVSGAGVLGTFAFDRAVTVNGSLVGTGTAISEGMATGASGFSGSAFGAGEFGSTSLDTDTGATTAATSSSNVESEAAMIGSVSTRANMQLNGAETRFAAANGTTLSESNEGFAYSALTSDPTDLGINIAALDVADIDAATTAFGTTNGVSFQMDSALGDDIDLSIANAGGGSVALSGQTGGFFNGGSSAFGNFEFGTTTD
ncbi:unnamed protein product [Ectocarpus fasciculatus]